jgi:hypothetical protein
MYCMTVDQKLSPEADTQLALRSEMGEALHVTLNVQIQELKQWD